MKNSLLYILILFSLLAVNSGPAQNQALRFNTYTMEDGLSHPGTFYRESIIQDQEGFLWISTLNGLNRFDGRNFKVFQFDNTNQNSLNSNLTTGLAEAEDGKLWVGTSTGINIFNPESEVFELLQQDLLDSTSLCGNGVNFIRKDQDGNMWVGTQKNGICRYDAKNKAFDNFNGFFRNGLVFFQQNNGTIWLGNFEGLHQYLPSNNSFKTYEVPSVEGDPRIQPAADICELKNGNLLISSTFSGLWEFNPSTETFKDISNIYVAENSESPKCVLCDQSGFVWMGSVGELVLYDPISSQTKVFQYEDDDPYSLPIPTLVDGYEDKAGSIWFHVIGIGPVVTHTIDNPFQVIGDFAMSQSLHMDESLILMNTGEGIKVYDIIKESFVDIGIPKWFDNLRGRSLVYVKKQGLLFIRDPNRDEIHQFNLETKTTSVIPIKGWLRSDVKGRPWIKLNYLDFEKNQWINIRPELEEAFPELTSNRLFGDEAYFNDEHTIWIETAKGVLHYNLETKNGEHYLLYPEDSTIITEIQFIYPGEEGRFYCFSNNGLSMFDPEIKGFRHFEERNGLLHNQAHAIIEDTNGNTWIGSPRGLQKLDRKTGAFSNYDMNDGLINETILHQYPFRDKLGYLYFSIAGKLLRFHPDDIKEKEYAPPIYLLDLYLNHQLVQSIGKDSLLPKQLRYCQNLDLNYQQSDFGFSFIMPVFYKAEETEYFYQLYPYDEDWKSLGTDNQVNYTNIDPGAYTFRVKGKTSSGNWSPNVATLAIQIHPPWWETLLAYLIYGLLFLGLLYGFYKFILNRQLEKAESKRLVELDNLKSRLYTNITHEFRTPLTVIMGMTNNIRGHSQEKGLITRNSKNLLRLINQLLDLSKLDSGTLKMDKIQGDIVLYLQYLTESFYSMAQEKNIRLTFYPEVKSVIMDYDETKIQHIIYNLLTNAIKFTGEGGKVILHLKTIEKYDTEWLHIKVSDTGIGISPESLPKIFDRFYQGEGSATRREVGTGIGLALTKELVEMMGGNIKVESKLGIGTDFIIQLPVTTDVDTPVADNIDPTYKSDDSSTVEQIVPTLEVSTFNKSAETPSLLIIEDNPDVVTYIESLLKKDYQIEIARNGQEGIDKALDIIPDIIISDVMMPQKNGYEVCQALKTDERSSHIPIILLTAKATPEDRIEGLKEGADAYLTKPFNKEELFIRLKKLVEIRKSLQERFAGQSLFSSPPRHKKDTELSLDDRFLQKLITVVEDRLDDPDLAVVHLCRAAQLSNTQVNRKLKALTGKTPSQFIRLIRLQKAYKLLQTTNLNVSEIAYDVGFNDPNYFSRSFSEEFGFPPNALRK